MRGTRAALLLTGGGVVISAVALVLQGDERAAQAGTQQCNTACQEKMTDCILDCDGVLRCELGCKSAAVGCVIACTDGGAPRPPERDLDAGFAPRAELRTDASDAGSEDGAFRGLRADASRVDGGRTTALPRDH